MEDAEERALRLCQVIGATTMFKEWNNGMSLPLKVSKDIAIAVIDELCSKTEYWEMVKFEIEKL
jgi:hypothetical protein